MADLTLCDRSALGHAWYPVPDDGSISHPGRTFYHRLIVVCERCGTRRVTGLNSYGEIEARWYDYPEGWGERWAGAGGERPQTNEIRLLMTQKRLEERRK